jgi:hypothetical protein
MNHRKLNISFLLIPIGLLVTSSTFFIQRFMVMTDFTEGAIKGGGIGLMLLGLGLMKFNPRLRRS